MQPAAVDVPERALRGPWSYLGWVFGLQLGTQALGVLFGAIWMLSQALVPAAVSRAIDQGITGRSIDRLVLWSAVVLGLAGIGAMSGVYRHKFAVLNWLGASFRSMRLVGYHAADTGAALPRQVPTGQVVTVTASDSMRLGAFFDTMGRFGGALISYVVVAVILLATSVPLGLLVLLGVPVLLASLTCVVKPLQRKQSRQREESGKLTELGADTVAGLRVLRGIGGEHTFLARYEQQSQRVRRSGVQVASLQATLDAAQVLLPGIFVLIVTWLGARAVHAHTITAGQLVAFYGYAMFLVMPLRTATEMADKTSHALIAARKIIQVLTVSSDTAVSGSTMLPAGPQPLVDETTGIRIEPGRLTAVVCERPEESAALADRLGRFGPTPGRVTFGGVALEQAPIAQVRSRITVSENDPRLFTGLLRSELADGRSDVELRAALEVTSAADVLDALPDGLDSRVEERGRSFSGGQRQRLALARALLIDAETLVLVEPTSAVDAHTEARIAGRLAAARRGRTTVVMTASPLLLDQADEVILLADGHETTRGTHHVLLREHSSYRRIVLRGDETEGTPR